MTPDSISKGSPVHDTTPDDGIPCHPLQEKKTMNKKGHGTNVSMRRLVKRRQVRRTTQQQEPNIKVDWRMFPKDVECIDNTFSSEDSKELFVTGLEEMAPSCYLLEKIFRDDERIRSIQNRRPSIGSTNRFSS
jgi:hypothetical protein